MSSVSVIDAMRNILCRAALLLWLSPAAMAGTVVVAEIDGAISPPSAAYFQRALEQAGEAGAELMVLRLNTPGGLDASMRQMIQDILASPVPVATFVSPSGARAASAGTYLLYASHIAAMAPGTNLGAATPVSIGIGGEQPSGPSGDGKPAPGGGSPGGSAPGGTAMEKKVVQDAVAYLRSLAQMRGRNVEWAEKAVREAASLSAGDALEQKVVDYVAVDLAHLLKQADGRSVAMEVGERRLDLADPAIVVVEPNWQESLLEAVANPNIALILMMLGVYGLLFEFYNPSFGVAGIVGVICLLLAMYALAMLPINAVGALLLLAGIVLMAAEAFFPSFGVLGIGGVIAFVVGALMLVDAEVPGMEISLAFVLPLAAASALVLAGIGGFALRARRRPVVSGSEAMVGGTAEALDDFEGSGWVLAFGERWQARGTMKRGERARITAVDGLTLVVQPERKGDES
jgi:membrane-bound serine protease (ClpP class)